jgi:hypothetical protein
MDSRAIAMGTVDYIVGPPEEMEAHMNETMQTLRRVLELPPLRSGESAEPATPEQPAAPSKTEAA